MTAYAQILFICALCLIFLIKNITFSLCPYRIRYSIIFTNIYRIDTQDKKAFKNKFL